MSMTDTQYRDAARELHGSDGVLEIDEDAVISRGVDPGAYVAAWVWVSSDDGEPSEDGGTDEDAESVEFA
jgi:hypothetical protein